ncbi:MAG: hypothetical protein HQ537_02695 [Parcubacteria group bacterium]|nr:hypothetical protein [Parcubacteria group bacterium]
MLTAQKKLLLSLIIGLAGFTLFIGLVIFPLMNRIKIASQECLNNQDILAKLDQRVSLFKELKKNYQDNEDNVLSLNNAFLDSEETVGLITDLETIANQIGNFFEIKSVSSSLLDKEKIEGDNPYLMFNIYLRGSFPELLNFMANLENIPYPPYRLMEIDDLVIKRLAKEDLAFVDFDLGEGNLETILSIKVYIQ